VCFKKIVGLLHDWVGATTELHQIVTKSPDPHQNFNRAPHKNDAQCFMQIHRKKKGGKIHISAVILYGWGRL
jgi:hypothetical protein